MTQATVVTPETAARWQSALRRALNEAVDILTEPISGETFAESSTQLGVLYAVTRVSCTCSAGRNGVPCKHRAAFLCQLGELELQDERVTFFGDADRQEIRVDGRFFGNALFTDEGGWQLYRGTFPRARRMGAYRTLEEIRTDLMARMPVALPAQPAARFVSSMLDTSDEMASVA